MNVRAGVPNVGFRVEHANGGVGVRKRLGRASGAIIRPGAVVEGFAVLGLKLDGRRVVGDRRVPTSPS